MRVLVDFAAGRPVAVVDFAAGRSVAVVANLTLRWDQRDPNRRYTGGVKTTPLEPYVSKPVVLIAEELSPATISALGPDFEIRHCDGSDRAELFPPSPTSTQS